VFFENGETTPPKSIAKGMIATVTQQQTCLAAFWDALQLIIADLHSSLDPKEVQRTNDISGISNILFPAIRTVAVFQQPIHSNSFQVHRTFHEISLPCFSDFSELPRHERDLDSRILDLSIESNSRYFRFTFLR